MNGTYVENFHFNNISKVLENVDDSNYVDKIINSFSHEDRLNFYREICFNKQFTSLYSKVSDKFKYLLTQEEIIEIIASKYRYATVNSMIESHNKKYLFYLFDSLNEENKVKEFLKLDKTLKVYACNSIFDTDYLRSYFINSIKQIDDSDDRLPGIIVSIINNITDFDLKLQCADNVASIYPKIYLQNPINKIDESKMEHYFNDLGLSDITKSFLVSICPSAQVAKKYFLELDDDIAKANASRRFSVSYINETNMFLDDEYEHIDDDFSFEDLKEMLFSFNDQGNRLLMVLRFEDFEKFKFLPLITEEEKIEVLSNMDDPKLLFKGLNYLSGILSITRVLTFYKGEFPKYREDFEKLIISYAKVYGVNSDHLIELAKVTSLEIINHLSNRNIKSLINMNDEDFNKFLSLFNESNTKLSPYTLSNIFNAFANRSFNLNYEDIMHYYSCTMIYCQEKYEYGAKRIIRKVLYELNEDLEAILGLDKDLIIKDYSVNGLYNALVNSDPDAMNNFHTLCNEYIKRMREREVTITLNMYYDEYLDTSYEVSSSIKAIMEYGTSEWLYNTYLSKMLDEFSPREKELLEDKDLFKKIYEFKLNPTQSPPPIIKTNMFIFNKIMDKFYSEYKSDDIIYAVLVNANVKKVPVIPDVDSKFIIDIMSNLNAEKLKSKLLDDKDLYKEFSGILKKYSFLAFNKRFEDIQLDADTYCDAESVSSLFLNYKDIMRDLKKSKTPISMSSILAGADTYNKSSIVYKELYGEDNFRLITLNPPLNRANTLREERREESLKNFIKCYNRTKVAVPSFDEDIDIGDKMINVVVGNFTNPINLTLGERTGSCMRSGGVGDDLYNFCLGDPRGLHIIFNDPTTGEFVSRVSGFRNGNTVFLNQLRDSVIQDYVSKDLIEAMKIVADEIIEKSKDSEHPIDNVIISADKAMEDYEVETVNIGGSNIFDGMNAHFWFDLMPNSSIVLSSSNNGELVPVKLGNQDISYYPVQRDKIRYAINPTDAVKHIEATEQLLSGKKIEEIEVPQCQYDACYYGEDWYVAVDKDGKIIKKIISSTKDSMSAVREMDIAYENIKNVQGIFDNEEDKLIKK